MKIRYEYIGGKTREIDDAPDRIEDFERFIDSIADFDYNGGGCQKFTFEEWIKDALGNADGLKGLAAAMEYETDRVKYADYSGDCSDLTECDVYDIGYSDNHKLIFAAPDADPRQLLQYLCDAVERDTFYNPTVTE